MQNNDTPVAKTNFLELVHSGEDYFARLERIILESKTEIHIQTYIFEYDAVGKKIIEALQVAASRNVKIHVLLDGFGSFSFLNFTVTVMVNLSLAAVWFAWTA